MATDGLRSVNVQSFPLKHQSNSQAHSHVCIIVYAHVLYICALLAWPWRNIWAYTANHVKKEQQQKLTFFWYTCSKIQRSETEWNWNDEESTWFDKMFRIFHCTTECRQIERKILNPKKNICMERKAQTEKNNISSLHMDMYVYNHIPLDAIRIFSRCHRHCCRQRLSE